jgi:arsenite methyltransferase
MKYLEEIDHTVPGFGEFYDELPLWSAPFGLLLLDRVPMKSGLTILDVGAGTGFLTLELAQRCGPSTKVIAVDPWKAGMSRLRKKLKHLNLTNVVLLEQDAVAMDVPDSSVDVIVSNLGINNFADPAAALRACHRVGKSGARLFLTTNVKGHMAELYDVYRETLIELGHTEQLPALQAHVAHRGTADSVASLLRSAGFRVVHIAKDSFRMRFADGSYLLRHRFIRLGFLSGWKSVAPADALQKTFETFERNLNAFAARRGELALTIPMICIEARKKKARSVVRR